MTDALPTPQRPLYAQRLKQARSERGWTQPALMNRMREQAARRGTKLVGDDSLKRRISDWENGVRPPDDRYQAILCAVYDADPTDLGFDDAGTSKWGDPDPTVVELLARLDSSRNIDDELIALYGLETNAIRMKDRRLGAAIVAPRMTAHIGELDQLLKHAMLPVQRTGLARVLADASALAGWQGVDTGSLTEAWEHFERAKAAGAMAQDPAILAFATAEQAYVLLDLGQAESALQIIEYAHQADRLKLPALVRSWLHAAEAEAHAALNDELSSLRAMDAAAAILPSDPDDPDLPFLALNLSHLSRWRGSCLARLGDSQAIDDLTEALTGVGGFTRAEAGLRCDLAEALIKRGRTDEARQHLTAAQKLITVSGSARQRRRLIHLTGLLGQ